MSRIAVICDYILTPKRIGGMDRFFKLFNQIMKEKGHRVDWYFPVSEQFDFYKDFNIIAIKGSSTEAFFVEHSSVNQIRYDAICTHFTEICSPYYKKISELNPNAQVIAVDHNPRPLNGFPLKKKIKNRIKSVLYAKYIDDFIAVSNYSKEHLIKDFSNSIASKITIINNGIETERFEHKKNYSSHTNFIMASHLRKEKGIQDVILAVGNLGQELREKMKVSIYGEGPYKTKLKEIIHEHSLEKQFQFMGSVSDLYLRYANYDYLIHASYGETYCYSVVESLVAKLPVITTMNRGNVLQLVEDKLNGFLFEAGELQDLTEILEKILTKESIISAQSFSKSKSPDMSIQKMVAKHINLLKCI